MIAYYFSSCDRYFRKKLCSSLSTFSHLVRSLFSHIKSIHLLQKIHYFLQYFLFSKHFDTCNKNIVLSCTYIRRIFYPLFVHLTVPCAVLWHGMVFSQATSITRPRNRSVTGVPMTITDEQLLSTTLRAHRLFTCGHSIDKVKNKQNYMRQNSNVETIQRVIVHV